MRLGEAIENAIRKLVDYCHRKDVRCENCPFISKDNKCDMNMGILEDLVHFTDAEIIPQKEDVENFKKAYENVVALEISADIDTPSRYQTKMTEAVKNLKSEEPKHLIEVSRVACTSCEYCRTDYAGFVETGGMMRLTRVGEPVCTLGKDVYGGEVVALGDTKELCEMYTERKCEVGE